MCPPVHLARLNHPSHLALSFRRAVLSAEAINIQHVWGGGGEDKVFTTKTAAGEFTTDSCKTANIAPSTTTAPKLQ